MECSCLTDFSGAKHCAEGRIKLIALARQATQKGSAKRDQHASIERNLSLNLRTPRVQTRTAVEAWLAWTRVSYLGTEHEKK